MQPYLGKLTIDVDVLDALEHICIVRDTLQFVFVQQLSLAVGHGR